MIERIERVINYLKDTREVLSQAEFADKIGINPSQVSEMLNGKRVISERTIRKISKTFPNLNIDWLLSGSGDMTMPAKNPFSQMTDKEIGATMTETFTEELMKAYKRGEIYPSEVVDKIVADKNLIISEKERRIEELQREIWELQRKIEDLTK